MVAAVNQSDVDSISSHIVGMCLSQDNPQFRCMSTAQMVDGFDLKFDSFDSLDVASVVKWLDRNWHGATACIVTDDTTGYPILLVSVPRRKSLYLSTTQLILLGLCVLCALYCSYGFMISTRPYGGMWRWATGSEGSPFGSGAERVGSAINGLFSGWRSPIVHDSGEA